MIEDLSSCQLPKEFATDVCVIGAGAAGISLSLTLARKGIDVLLLESGGEEPDTESDELNKGEIVGLPHVGMHEGRFRALGGTTTRWGGQMLPLQEIDFEERSWIAYSGWPIEHSSLSHYYESALSFSGLGKSIRDDTEVWKRIALDVPYLGQGIETYVTRWCPEPNFARLYAEELKRQPSLKCILHATVTGFDSNGGRVTTLIAKNLHRQTLIVSANRFVLCLGGIETARCLLQPLNNGTLPPWTSDLVGRFFQDHPGIQCADVLPKDRHTLHKFFDNIFLNGHKYQPRFRLSASAQRHLRLPNIAGIILFQSKRSEALSETRQFFRAMLQRPTVNRAVIQSTFNAIATGSLSLLARQAWRALVQHRAFNLDDLGFRLGAQLEQVPNPNSRICLSDQCDSLGIRRAQLDWRLGNAELESIAKFAKVVKECFRRQGIGEVIIDTDVEISSPQVLSRVRDQNHHMGTARMAYTQKYGVVDPNLRLFGTENTYVCSSAVFPTSGNSNPTHTIIALALRLADHLYLGVKSA